MNKRFHELYKQAAGREWRYDFDPDLAQEFARLMVQAIYDEVKEELVDDSLVYIEPDSLMRQYLKGCNGGITDALHRIGTFLDSDDEGADHG